MSSAAKAIAGTRRTAASTAAKAFFISVLLLFYFIFSAAARTAVERFLSDFLVDVVSYALDDLDDDYQDRYGVYHYVRLEAVVAVFDSEVAEAAAADYARHRGVAEQVYRNYGPVEDERGHGLFYHYAPDYLPRGSAEGLRRLDDAAVDLKQAAFHEARDEWRRRDGQRHDRGGAAYRGADDDARQRDYRDEQYYEGEGAQKVDYDVEHAVERRVRAQAGGAGNYHEYRDAGAEYAREHRRDDYHIKRFPKSIKKLSAHCPLPPRTFCFPSAIFLCAARPCRRRG